MQATITVGRVILFLAIMLFFLLVFTLEEGPKALIPYRKRLWYLSMGLGATGLVVYGFETGFVQSLLKYVFSAVAQAIVPCASGLFGLLVLPLIFDKAKRIPRPLLAGVVAVLVVIGVAIFAPTFFSRYWLAMVMSLVYLVGIYLAWQRSHTEPPTNQSFYQGGAYAYGYTVDYAGP